MPFSIPYVMVKNVENKQQMLVDYSKNPCPNELSDFLKCVRGSSSQLSLSQSS